MYESRVRDSSDIYQPSKRINMFEFGASFGCENLKPLGKRFDH